jgi:hypothetical protein
MKIALHHRQNSRPLPGPHPRRENGMATVIFISLLAIMMILVMAELRCLFHLNREVKFLEKQQIKRLAFTSAQAGKSAPAADKPSSP